MMPKQYLEQVQALKDNGVNGSYYGMLVTNILKVQTIILKSCSAKERDPEGVE